MKNLPLPGRYLFALATIGIGLVHFVTGNFPSSLLPFPLIAGRLFLVYLIGFVFCAGGISLLFERVALPGAIVIGSTFLLLFLFPHLPKLLSNVNDPGEWTVAAETLALCCGAFIVARVLPATIHSTLKLISFYSKVLKLAPYVFALSLIVFAVQHYLYAKFIATIIPLWMPAPMFLSYLVMIVFIITSFSILFSIQQRNAALVFGCMFLIMFLLLHVPRVINNPHLETEWTSMFIALAMTGIGFTQAINGKKQE
jgi:uncharacterized membrane protein